jgi:hypothetical protein
MNQTSNNAVPVTLHDGRPGLRSLLQVEALEPAADSQPSTTNSQPTLDFISSTATLDRYHEIIEPAGWRLDSYRRNPVFQNAHNYGDILFTLGKALITEIRTVPREEPNCLSTPNSRPSTCLYQRIQFATDVNPIARIAYGLYKGRFLNAVSVGFVPIRWEDSKGARRDVLRHPRPSDGRGAGGEGPRRRYLEQELLEVSAVAIPANPDALALGLKSGAVTKADLADTLDLLRSLTVDYGPWLPAHVPDPQLSTFNSQLALARELRRILRRT